MPKDKKEAPAPEKKARRSKFEALYPEDARFKLLVKENPKKAGSKSFDRFQGYFGAKTIGAALAAGVTYADVAYDIGRRFIEVEVKEAA